MNLWGEQFLLRVYLREADRAPHMPTFERIVKTARRGHLAGATILKGILGAGSRGLLEPSSWSITEHLPVIVEVVDSAERIMSFVHGPLSEHMVGGMATLERAHVMMYRQRHHDQPADLGLGLLLPLLSTLPRIQSGVRMKVNENGVLLRVFAGESDKFESRPLHEAIVRKVRDLGLAGATVLRGVEGFGANSVVHKAGILGMSTDLPIVIEIVDTEDKIQLLLPHLDKMVAEGMITMEHVMILMYRDKTARNE